MKRAFVLHQTPQNGESGRVDKTKDRLRQKMIKNRPPVTLCLAMIVRNESKNMVRILDSIKSIVDYVSIVDTGSIDNTISIIEDWGKESKIPTKVTVEPFQNFGYNRTHCFQKAKELFPKAAYVLLSDADFIWEIVDGFNKENLIEPRYMVEQTSSKMSYWNQRIFSTKYNWVCLGVTHEYWDLPENVHLDMKHYKFCHLRIDDREDGGHKSDKFERDERLLRAGLADKKSNKYLKTRYRFYLAQTLMDSGRQEEAVELYKKRIDDKGWEEEIYHSTRKIGYCYEQLGWKIKDKDSMELDDAVKHPEIGKFFDLAEEYYSKSWEYRKSRAEGLYDLTHLQRIRGKTDEAYRNCQIGKMIPYPEDTLFVEFNVYQGENGTGYMFNHELSIVCWYNENRRKEGLEACKRLLQRKDLPGWIRDETVKNFKVYLEDALKITKDE